jgi:Putative peptidoglycan binding domain
MTPGRVRLTLLAIMAIFLATAGNALFLQERARTPAPTWAGRIQAEKPAPVMSQPEAASLPAPAREAPPAPMPAVFSAPPTQSAPPAPSVQQPTEAPGQRLVGALERELSQRGYTDQLRTRSNGLRLAILAYEFDAGMPLTGQPTETLLKQILFDLNQAPHGAFADRAEVNPRLVMEIQKTLLGLGFFRGNLSARMDLLTAGAVKDFERHRALPLTGRLNEATLLELISYSGQPLRLSSN